MGAPWKKGEIKLGVNKVYFDDSTCKKTSGKWQGVDINENLCLIFSQLALANFCV